MNTRRVILIFVAFALVVSATALWEAQGDERDGDTATNVVAAGGAQAGSDAPQKKKGGGFLHALKAPFKAVGRLFGRGGDDGRVASMTEKDAARLESAAVVRVEDRDNTRPAVPDDDGTARGCLERGRALLQEGDLNDAIAELSRAVSLDPRLSQAHSLLAVAYDQKGLHDRAQDSYKHAIDANENDPQAQNNLGYSLYLNGNYRAAVDRLKRAARLAPTDARILNNLALAQVRLGKYDDAYPNFPRPGGEVNGHTTSTVDAPISIMRDGVYDDSHGNTDARRDRDDGPARPRRVARGRRARELPLRPRAQARRADAGADDAIDLRRATSAARARRG